MGSGRGLCIGVALGRDGATAVVLGKGTRFRATVPLAIPENGGDPTAELVRAFLELKEQLESAGIGGTQGATVHAALLPPLADTRLVPLPPLRASEAEAVLRRNVAKYFMGARPPQVVGLAPLSGRRRGEEAGGGTAPVLAAAASSLLLEAILVALAQAGWRPGSFSAAHGGWIAAALALGGSSVPWVLAVVDGTTHLIQMEGRDPVAVRRLPSDAADGFLSAMGTGGGRALVLGSPSLPESLREGLARFGWAVSGDPGGWASAEESAAARAGDPILELVPLSRASARERKTRRLAVRLAAAAAVLVAAAAGAEFLGAQREMQAVRDRRAAMAEEVGPLLVARDSLTGLLERTRAMEELAAARPRWTRAMVDLAELLPEDTYLTALYATGDTVELEAAGSRAGEAIQALKDGGLFREVRLQGIVDRELENGETVVERFRLWARLAPGPGRGGP